MIKFKNLIYCSMLAACVVLPSCSDDDDEPVEKTYLKLTTDVVTRNTVLKTGFSDGDKMSVGVDGVKYEASYNGSQWMMSTDVELSEKSVTVSAFYPATTSDIAAVPVDITKQVDYLFGTATASKNAPTAKLSMNHALSSVAFNVQGSGTLESISFDAPLAGTVNVSSGIITVKENGKQTIEINKEMNATGWTSEVPDAFAIPSTVSDVTFKIDGKEYQTKIGTKTEAGTKYIFRLAYTAGTVKLINVDEISMKVYEDKEMVEYIDTLELKVHEIKNYPSEFEHGIYNAFLYNGRPVVTNEGTQPGNWYYITDDYKFEPTGMFDNIVNASTVSVYGNSVYYAGWDNGKPSLRVVENGVDKLLQSFEVDKTFWIKSISATTLTDTGNLYFILQNRLYKYSKTDGVKLVFESDLLSGIDMNMWYNKYANEILISEERPGSKHGHPENMMLAYKIDGNELEPIKYDNYYEREMAWFEKVEFFNDAVYVERVDATVEESEIIFGGVPIKVPMYHLTWNLGILSNDYVYQSMELRNSGKIVGKGEDGTLYIYEHYTIKKYKSGKLIAVYNIPNPAALSNSDDILMVSEKEFLFMTHGENGRPDYIFSLE